MSRSSLEAFLKKIDAELNRDGSSEAWRTKTGNKLTTTITVNTTTITKTIKAAVSAATNVSKNGDILIKDLGSKYTALTTALMDELRDNFKDYFNVILLKKTQEDESFKNLGELGILVTGFAGKFIEYTIDAYLNPEGLSLLLEKSEKKDEIPEPTLITLFGSFTIMNFNGLSSFYITYENEGEEFPIFFNRQGLKWKITQIEFPESLFDDLKY